MAKTKSMTEKIAELVAQQTTETDELLRAIVVERNVQPNPTDLAYFRNLGWDVSMLAGSDRNRKSLLRELNRVTNVIADQAIAGTYTQRQELRDEYAAAQQEADEKVPALEEEINRLKAEQNKLIRRPQQLAKRLDECEAAVKRLRENVPLEIRQAAQEKLNELYQSEPYRKLRSMKSRVEAIEKILVVPSSSEQARLHAGAVKSGLLQKLEHGWEVNPTAWSEYLKDLRGELADIQSELPELEATVGYQLTKTEKEFDFYAG